jgi:uncharacterized protein (DUF58 family)
VNPSDRFSSTFLSKLELLRLESKRKFLGSKHGGHISLKKGHGIEFSDYRQYQLGDNPRYIDWKVYGRSEKLYVKRSQEDQDFSVSIFLDVSPSMGIETDQSKWSFSSDLALSFAYLALAQQDKLQINLLGSKLRLSANSLKSFWTVAEQLRASSRENIVRQDFSKSLKLAAAQTKFPGLAILISDLHLPLEELEDGLRYLMAKNLEIVVLQVLSKQDFEPCEVNQDSNFEDAENSDNINLNFSSSNREMLSSMIQSHSDKCRQICNSKQIAFSVLKSEQDLIECLRNSKEALRIIR